MSRVLWRDEISVLSALHQLPSLLTWVRERLQRTQASEKFQARYELALEEAIVNILQYAYPESEGQIKIACTFYEDEMMEFSFTDQGISFNPLLHKQTDPNVSIEKMEPGGMGILLMKKNVDAVDYQRKEGSNILMLKKNMR